MPCPLFEDLRCCKNGSTEVEFSDAAALHVAAIFLYGGISLWLPSLEPTTEVESPCQGKHNVLEAKPYTLKTTTAMLWQYSCHLSSWRFLTLIDILGTEDGGWFTVSKWAGCFRSSQWSHTNSIDPSIDPTLLGIRILTACLRSNTHRVGSTLKIGIDGPETPYNYNI